MINKELLAKHNVIKNVFNYQEYDLDEETLKIYSYFENEFVSLYESYSDLYNIKDCCFFIKNNNTCNAFASKRKGYNIIGITSGYPILLSKKMDKKHFNSIVLAGIYNDEPMQEAYIDLYQDENFDFEKFFIDCSIKFTFRHEFQHIIQFNSSKFGQNIVLFQENLVKDDFDIKRHVWEYDADRIASFDILKYVFRVHSKFEVKSDEKLKCLMYVGCSSMIITKCLLYFGAINQLSSDLTVRKMEFYKKKFSHPHPLVRCINIMTCYTDNIVDDFPKLEIDNQEFLNNILGITKLYFDSLIPGQDVMKEFFKDLTKHIDTINDYNDELYDLAIQDEAIRNYLISKNIEFEGSSGI